MDAYKDIVDNMKNMELNAESATVEQLSSNNIVSKCLNPFTNLQTVSIQYSDIGEDLLKALASNSRLKSLCIICKTDGIFPLPRTLPPVSDDVWREVKKLSPELKVGLILGFGNWILNNLRQVLSAEVPLVWLHYDSDVPRNNCIQYLIENFHETLEDVNLNFVSILPEICDSESDEEADVTEDSGWDYDEEEEEEAEREARKGELYENDHEIVESNDDDDDEDVVIPEKCHYRCGEGLDFYEKAERVDESILELIKCCSRLKSIKLWGHFEMDIIDQIYLLRKRGKIGLQCLYIYFFGLSPNDQQLLAAKKRQYDLMELPFDVFSFSEITMDSDEDNDSESL